MREYAILVLGVAVCLVGAALMVFGKGLLGESHTGIAAVTGIVGIGHLGLFAALFAARSSKESSEETKSSRGGA